MKKLVFFVMTKKGLYCLEEFIKTFGPDTIDCVVSSRDPYVIKDYYDEIAATCIANNIRLCNRNDVFSLKDKVSFAIGWKWLIRGNEGEIYIFHDSLLPRYRGFSTLVSHLLNKEEYLGVTLFEADDHFDTGKIISSNKVKVLYPIKIEKAIDKLSSVYAGLLVEFYQKLLRNEAIELTPQDENLVTYSVWRDEDDYRIDWHKSSDYLKRFVDSVGFPFLGAFSETDGAKITISEVEEYADCILENRVPGKVLFLEEGHPVVICGNGMLKIIDATDRQSGRSILPLKKFRTRFY
jgi:methionyl-tRNA formyltransferase